MNENWVQGSNINSKHLGTKSTRLLKKKIKSRKCQTNWGTVLQIMKSRESAAHKANKQTVGKKKTEGCSSGKCNATRGKQSWVSTTSKQLWCNFYDRFVSQKHCMWPRICTRMHFLWPIAVQVVLCSEM